MGLTLSSGTATATRPDAAGINFPAATATGLEFWHMLTDGTANVARNWASGKTNAVVTGSPIARNDAVTGNPSYIELRASSAYYTTAQPDSAGETSQLIVACAIGSQDPGSDYSQTGQLSYYVGSSDGNGGGAGIWVGTPNSVYAQAGYLPSNGQGAIQLKAAQVATNPSTWRCFIATYAATAITLRDMTSGISTTTPISGLSRKANGLPVQIGSAQGAARQGSLQTMIAAGASRAWTEDECSRLYALARRIAATKNISI
jgi:hypothetical protein